MNSLGKQKVPELEWRAKKMISFYEAALEIC